MNLEQLYYEQPGSPEYDSARNQAIKACAEYIADLLKDPSSAHQVANALFNAAEEMGRIEGDGFRGEVPSHLTKSGQPLPFMGVK